MIVITHTYKMIHRGTVPTYKRHYRDLTNVL
jgi:hypothetical protein